MSEMSHCSSSPKTMNTNQTTSPETSDSGALFGLGVRILPAEHKVEFLFEADGIAEDASGNPVPAGVKVGLDIRSDVPLRTLTQYEEAAQRFERAGIADLGLVPGKFRRVTWEHFQREGYDE